MRKSISLNSSFSNIRSVVACSHVFRFRFSGGVARLCAYTFQFMYVALWHGTWVNIAGVTEANGNAVIATKPHK
jgi:hypothetical protein